MQYPQRKHLRIPGYDYSQANYYYVTICTREKECLFGMPDNPTALGNLAKDEMEKLAQHYEDVVVDKFVIMPNHIHAIFAIGCSREGENPSLSQVVASYKAGVSRKSGTTPWQKSFYDEVIRNEAHYQSAWNYIDGNPSKWAEDKYFIPRHG